eukprot:7127555-Pyramimonas_sp.AAC.1
MESSVAIKRGATAATAIASRRGFSKVRRRGVPRGSKRERGIEALAMAVGAREDAADSMAKCAGKSAASMRL